MHTKGNEEGLGAAARSSSESSSPPFSRDPSLLVFSPSVKSQQKHAIENTRSRTRDRELKSLSKMTTFFHSLLCFSFLLLLLFCFSLSLSQTVRSDRFFFVFFFSEKKDSLFPLSFGRLSKRERPTRRRKKEVSIDRSMIILFSSSAFLFFE